MSGLENLSIRLNYCGGRNQDDRMIKDKLKSLRKALLYSYQAETIINKNGQEFRCLINSDKLKDDYDLKMISIPYEDICLNEDMIGKTSEGYVSTGVKPGDVIYWKEQDTYWLVGLEYLEEDAYFKAEIRKCNTTVTINGQEYHVSVRGPVETAYRWNSRKNKIWNDMNYSLILYITRDENTEAFFHRFTEIMIDGQNWRVAAQNIYNDNGAIIEVVLEEYFNNEFAETEVQETETELPQNEPYIDGPNDISPWDSVQYTIKNSSSLKDKAWNLKDANGKATISALDNSTIDLDIISSKSGSFTLEYTQSNGKVISKNITIKSL